MKICRKLRMIFVTAFYNFRQWKGNGRVICAFLFAFILCFLLTGKLVAFAEQQETSMQLVEAFIWTFGDSNSILLASVLLLLLFGDMPFVTTATPFFLARESRKLWILGQIVYTFLATSLYLLFILVSTCVLCIKYSFVGNRWSETAAMLAYSDAGKEIALPATVKTLEMSRPYYAMLCIFLLMLLYALVLVFILLFFNIWKGQLAGVISALAFSVYGLLLNPENIQKLLLLPDAFFYKVKVWVGWLSPLNHATYSMHDFGYDNLPSLYQTVLLFIVLLALLVLFSVRAMQRYSFQFKGTEIWKG